MPKIYNYCTLFDSNYLTRGLAMYESLKQYSDDFHLYMFAFDDRSYQLLNKMKLPSVTVVSLQEFEDDELLEIKKNRTAGEYCWTCTPSIIKYSIEQYSLSHCTYLDADLYFFSSPSVLIEEMGDKSVSIIEHRYTPIYDQTLQSGKYCVQFMTFKNDKHGMAVLNWWQKACNNWCYNRLEDGKFGDQKYLDNWPEKFTGIYELQNLGGGVAPWNIQQYCFTSDSGVITGEEKLTKNKFELVFFHFHALKFLNSNKVDLGSYAIRNTQISLIYKKYLMELSAVNSSLKLFDIKFDYKGVINTPNNLKALIKNFKRCVKGTYNIYKIDKLKRL
jgi:hypothetical protein